MGPSTDDTLGILSSSANNNDGKGEERCRVLASPDFLSGGWQTMQGMFVLDCDAMIIPGVDLGTGSKGPVSSKGLRVSLEYISADKKMSLLKYSINKSQYVSIKVFDLSGKNIINTGYHYKKAGAYELTVNLNNFASANYYCTITTENTSLTGKIVSVK